MLKWKTFYKDTLTVIILQQDSQDLTAVQLVSIKRHLRLRGKRPNSKNKLEWCWETRFFRIWEGTLEHNVCFSLLVITFLFPAFSQVGLLSYSQSSKGKKMSWEKNRNIRIILHSFCFWSLFFWSMWQHFPTQWIDLCDTINRMFSFGVKMSSQVKSSDSSKMSKPNRKYLDFTVNKYNSKTANSFSATSLPWFSWGATAWVPAELPHCIGPVWTRPYSL